jgi:transposase-like protein
MNRNAKDKSEIVANLPSACSDERKAVEFMEQQRWGKEPYCPHCGCFNATQLRDKKTGERNARFLWKCRDCSKQFTVRIGTVFEDSRIPLRHWCYAFWAACASKKGVSALQIKRMTGLSYKSALFLLHRIRFAMNDVPTGPLKGTIEADETYVGGKPRRGNLDHRKFKRGHPKDKAAVFALVERGGEARVWHIPTVSARNLAREIWANVDPSSRLMTDEAPHYRRLGKAFPGGHHRVMHSIKEYVRGEAHVNTAESFFAILKRGINGTYHAVSKKHLHRYLSEFAYRWNTRKMDDGERTATAIRKADGKRLRYKEPVAEAQ